jgi:hypothetical protein
MLLQIAVRDIVQLTDLSRREGQGRVPNAGWPGLAGSTA